MQSSRTGYYPYSKDEWIAAFEKIYRREGKVSTKYLQHKYSGIYHQGIWLFGDRDEALRALSLSLKKCE
jgi:hypothetical protein